MEADRLKDICVCEGCDNDKIIKHFEKCEKCFSTACHKTITTYSQDDEKGGNE